MVLVNAKHISPNEDDQTQFETIFKARDYLKAVEVSLVKSLRL